MTTEVVKVEIGQPVEISQAAQPQASSIIAVIARAASDPTVDVDKMQRLLEMQERLMARQAEQLFRDAMSRFQDECPIIVKSKDGARTKSGNLVYKFAPLDKIVAAVKGLLTKHGFSYKIETEFPDNRVRAICIVTHIGGHSERTSVELPLITKTDIMSAPQVTSGTITFAKRVAFSNAFGIMTADEDNDAGDGGDVSDKDMMQINDLLSATGWDDTKVRDFLTIYDAESVERLRAVHARPVIAYLTRIVRRPR